MHYYSGLAVEIQMRALMHMCDAVRNLGSLSKWVTLQNGSKLYFIYIKEVYT